MGGTTARLRIFAQTNPPLVDSSDDDGSAPSNPVVTGVAKLAPHGAKAYSIASGA